jgi:RNA polymerase sigma-70 factor (ECF subfamily)
MTAVFPSLAAKDRNMSTTSSHTLLARWRDAADQEAQEAATELYNRYSERLIALVRKRIAPHLARRLEPQDVVQSACRSFFLRVHDRRLAVEPGSDVWQLLVAIALRKLFGQVEFHTAAKRSIDREDSVRASNSVSLPPVEALAGEPSADEIAAFNEEIESLLSRLKPPRRRIVELRLQGYTQVEIATEVDRTERLVRIALDEFRDMLLKHWDIGEDA